MLETYRECLRDVFDVPGLHDLLRELHSREVRVVEVETADRLAVRLLAAVRLRRDIHVRGRHADRRAPRPGAAARPRAAARAARPGELRELLDPDALATSRPGCSGCPERAAPACRRPARPAAPVGDLTPPSGAAWSPRADGRLAGAARCRAPRRRGADRRRGPLIAAEDAGLYRDALGATRRAACPPPSSTGWPTRWPGSCGAGADARAVQPRELRDGYGLDPRRCSRSWRDPASWCAATSGPAGPSASGASRRCCGGCGARRWPRCGRRSSRSTSARSPASCRAGRASTVIR